MGKTQRWKRKNRNPKDPAKVQAGVPSVRKDYEEIIKENKSFVQYYKMQNICPDDEWDQFLDIIKEPLPSSFRITGSRSQARALLYILRENLIRDALVAGTQDAESHVKAFPLPWYPDDLAWQMNLSRTDIRRNEVYFRLHNFLISETESGNISRQEAVSMIPPVVLDIKPHHKVLDMCAAPGSKTAQIIEMLHADDRPSPEGFVVANDVDNKRCYMLVHQGKRLHSPAFLVTNHEGGKYPDLMLNDKDGNPQPIKFDRILCDVPCSGDGTLRKNALIWKNWTAMNGTYIHKTQYLVLKRGLELLQPGGLLVYSTCSLNPLENEAVVHHILQESGVDCVTLEDINLPALKHQPGLSTWMPCTKDMTPYSKFEDVPEKWKSAIRPYLFPPSKEDVSKFNLHKCVRVLPHQQDTGGFFIALLKKHKSLPWEKNSNLVNESGASEENNTADSEAPENENGIEHSNGSSSSGKPPPKKKPKRMIGYREDPFIFMKPDDDVWPTIREFYGLGDTLDSSNFIRRSENEGKVKNIYLTTPKLREFVHQNEKTVKIINVGVKALARVDKRYTAGDYRLCQEGLPALLPYITKRIVTVTLGDFMTVLLNDDVANPTPLEVLSDLAKGQLEPLDRGSVVLRLDTQVGDMKTGPKFQLNIVGWRGLNTLSAYIQKGERIHFLRLCGADISKYEINKFKANETKDKEPEKSPNAENEEDPILMKNENDDSKEKTSLNK